MPDASTRPKLANLLRLKAYLRPYAGQYVWLILAGCAGTGLGIAIPLLTKSVVDGPVTRGDPAGLLVFYLALGVVVAVSGAVLWAIFQAVRATRRVHPTIPSILTVVLIGWILWDFARSGKGDSPWLIWSNGLSWTSGVFSWLLAKGLPVAANLSAAVPEGLRILARR